MVRRLLLLANPSVDVTQRQYRCAEFRIPVLRSVSNVCGGKVLNHLSLLTLLERCQPFNWKYFLVLGVNRAAIRPPDALHAPDRREPTENSTVAGKDGVQRLSLEDYDSAQIDPQQVYARKSRTRTPGRKRRRCFTLPVAYETLLEEARGRQSNTSGAPGKNAKGARKLWTWGRQAKHKPSPCRVFPGLGEEKHIDPGEGDERSTEIQTRRIDFDGTIHEGQTQSLYHSSDEIAAFGAGHRKSLGMKTTASVHVNCGGHISNATAPSPCDTGLSSRITGGCGAGGWGRNNHDPEAVAEKDGCDILTLRSIGSASLAVARDWASTGELVRALLARGCHAREYTKREGGDCSAGCGYISSQSEEKDATGDEARDVVYALLTKAVSTESCGGHVPGGTVLEDRPHRDTHDSGGTLQLDMLHEWYEGKAWRFGLDILHHAVIQAYGGTI